MLGRKLAMGVALAVVAGWGAPVNATTVTVFSGDAGWESLGNSGGGSSAITDTVARNGNGSLELTGDRTRFVHGTLFDSQSNLGLLKDVSGFTFEWQIASDSVALLNEDYTPALRLHIWDPEDQSFSELVWEGAYNGTYGSTDPAVWYSTGTGDKFWRHVTGTGTTFDNGAQVTLAIADWSNGQSSGGTQWYSDEAHIVAISVGAGGSAGSDYHAFADTVTLSFGSQSTSYNFEVAPVPEPATLVLVGSGLVAFGLLQRRRRA